jgi:hypothetical protein
VAPTSGDFYEQRAEISSIELQLRATTTSGDLTCASGGERQLLRAANDNYKAENDEQVGSGE